MKNMLTSKVIVRAIIGGIAVIIAAFISNREQNRETVNIKFENNQIKETTAEEGSTELSSQNESTTVVSDSLNAESNIKVTDSKGTQIGNDNVQVNTFNE